MAATLLQAAGPGVTGDWHRIEVVSRGADLAKRFHAWGTMDQAVTIEASHLVDGTGDIYTLGTISAGASLDLIYPVERVRAKTAANQGVGTEANVQLSTGY